MRRHSVHGPRKEPAPCESPRQRPPFSVPTHLVAPGGPEPLSSLRPSLSANERCALLSAGSPRDADRRTPGPRLRPAATPFAAASTVPGHRPAGALIDDGIAGMVDRKGGPVLALPRPTTTPPLVPGSPFLRALTRPGRDSRACHCV